MIIARFLAACFGALILAGFGASSALASNPLTLTSPTFATGATGFGQAMTAGTGQTSTAPITGYPYTIEVRFKTTDTSNYMVAASVAGAGALAVQNGNLNVAGTTGPAVNDGGWHHYAAVFFAGGVFQAWIDGNQFASATNSGIASPVGQTLQVRNYTYSGTSYPWMNGAVDEVRFSSGARYSGSSFTAPTGPFTSDANTVALYHLDGDGTDASSAASTTIAPNNASIVYSPGNWNVTGTAATSIDPGAYFRVRFTGTSCAINFDVSRMYGSDPTTIRYSIDGRSSGVAALTGSAVACTMPSDTSALTSHLLEVKIVAMTQNAENWNPSATSNTAVVFTGLTLASAATTSTPARAGLSGLILGDSITAGDRDIGSVSSTFGTVDNDAEMGWAFTQRRYLGAEIGVIGHGGQGWLQAGGLSSNVPALPSAYAYLYSGVARSFAGLDFVALDEGENDATNNTVSAVTSTLTALLAATTAPTRIFVLVPFSGKQKANLQSAVAAVASTRVVLLDASGLTYSTTDGVHPDLASHQAVLAPAVAALVKANLPGFTAAGPSFRPGFH